MSADKNSRMATDESNQPTLERLQLCDKTNEEKVTEIVTIKHNEFSIGRGRVDELSHVILSVLISRKHCVFNKYNEMWTITDMSRFGILVNKKKVNKNTAVVLNDGDLIELDHGGEFKYKFVQNSELSPPAAKRQKMEDLGRDTFAKNVHNLNSEMQSRLQAAKMEQSQITEEAENLNNAYSRQIQELEKKFETERKKMEDQALAGEIQQKKLEEQRQEMEERLQSEKSSLQLKFEDEKGLLQKKLEEQRLREETLKQENEKLQATIEAEKQKFEQQLAEERRLLEQSNEEAQRKAQEEKAELESKLQSYLEQAKEQREATIEEFQQQLEKGSMEKQKLEEEHQKIMEQLKNQEMSAAQEMDEKRRLQERLQQMEEELKSKEEAQQKLNEELRKKEEEKAEELELLKAKQMEENKRIQDEMLAKEKAMRESLDDEIKKLQNDKQKLEADIRVEMDAASVENKQKYESELEKVKVQLNLMESKKQLLEKELADNNEEKEKMSTACFFEKRKVLEDFGELMQSELQCQICNELFIIATTLNCTHTFCKFCISEWKRKQGKRVPDCPICRARIISENRSIVLDNFIDRMVESLTDDLKEARQELLIERGVRTRPVKPSTSSAASSSTSSSAPQVAAGVPTRPGVVVNNLVHHGAPVVRTPTAIATNVRPVNAIQHANNLVLQGQVSQSISRQQAAQVQQYVLHANSNGTILRAVAPPQQGTNVVNLVLSNSANRYRVAVPPGMTYEAYVQQIRAQIAAFRSNVPQQPQSSSGPRAVAPQGQSSNVAAARAPQPVPGGSAPPAARNVTVPAQPRPPSSSSLDDDDEDVDEEEDYWEAHMARRRGHRYDPYEEEEVEEEEDHDSDVEVPGLPGSSYGGYGQCYNCGLRGHWSPGCPFRR